MADHDKFIKYLNEVRDKAGSDYSFGAVIKAWQKNYRVETAVNYCKVVAADLKDETKLIKLGLN